MIKTALLCVATAGLLTGCEMGPDYAPPPLPAGATDHFQSATADVTAPEAPPAKWWHLYDDPLLDQFVEEALAANADLAAAQSSVAMARASLDAARAGLFPDMRLSSGATYGRDPGTDEILEIDGHSPTDSWVFSGLLDTSYELDIFGHVRRSIEAAQANGEAAAAARDGAFVTIAAETARAYAMVCALGEQIAVANRSIDILSDETRITTERHRAGAGTRLDVLRSEALLTQTRATLPPLEGQRRAALYELTALLGRTPSRAPETVSRCERPPAIVPLLPVGDGASLLRRRPDIRQAERRLAAATASIGVAVTDLYPRISIDGLYGAITPDIGSFTSGQALAWGIGPAVKWTFPVQTGPRARIRQAEAAAQAALAMFDSAVLNALKELETAIARYKAEGERHLALIATRNQTEGAYRLASEAYRAGSLSSLDLLDAERSLVAAEAALASSDATLVDEQILVFKALAGWSEAGPA